MIRSLREAGRLQEIRHICSVSGGSILAAHLVLNWERYTGTDEEFREVEKELLNFTKRDVRGRILRRLPLIAAAQLIPRWVPFLGTYPRSRNALLRRELDTQLYHDARLDTLPGKPVLSILVTNMSSGGLCSFTQKGYSFDIEPGGEEGARTLPSVNLPVSLAVATSAAVPAMFQPQRVDHELFGVERGGFGPEQRLIDGGVYDNLGVRKLIHSAVHDGASAEVNSQGEEDQLVISDASATFDDHWFKKTTLVLGTALRAGDILMKRIYDLERERLEDMNPEEPCSELSFIRISDTHPDSALPEAVQRQAKFLRTDLDRFSVEEASVLRCHGHALGARLFPPRPGHQPSSEERRTCETAKKNRIVRILQKGADRRLRLFSIRDWVWVLQLVAVLLLVFWGIPKTGRWIDGGWELLFPSPTRVVIGGKTFEESSILLEIMAQLIEDAAPDIEVERRHYYGNNVELYYDLLYGELDVYAEYSGTLLAIHLRAEMEDVRNKDSHTTENLNDLLLESKRTKNLLSLPGFGFSNSYELVMLRSRATELGLVGPGKDAPTMEDLASLSVNTELTFGLTPTFITRKDCMMSIIEAYGINFRVPDQTAHALKADKLRKRMIDVTDFYETDAEDLEGDFILIQDNKGAWPLYEAAPLMRRQFAKENPAVVSALEKIKGEISRDEMMDLVGKAKASKAVGGDIARNALMRAKLRDLVAEYLQGEDLFERSLEVATRSSPQQDDSE